MAQHRNFYETVKEAQMRLRGTIVMYDKEPYTVIQITNHKADGIFRIYLFPLGEVQARAHWPSFALDNYHAESNELGKALDNFITEREQTKDGCKVLRKQMDSPLFNKYRPFPLGMCNIGARTYYVERQPARRTEQGLTKNMLNEVQIGLNTGSELARRATGVDVTSMAFRQCILGEHPDAQTCLKNLLSGEFENEAVAFNREFALVKGPLDMIFLAYKADIVGTLPNLDFSVVRLGKNFKHCKEVTEGLRLFTRIVE